MIRYPNIDPELFRIGPFSLRWYGLMYLIGFLSSYLLTLYQIKRKYVSMRREIVDDLYFYLILGLIIGARIGYVIFYNLGFYLREPLEIFKIWHGGMSFHGGLLGTMLVAYIFTKRRKVSFFLVADLIIPSCPVGLGLGRIGNFINGELFGKVTDVPWAMVFPNGGNLPRHPSQLYEALFEGLLLFLILWFYKDKKKFNGDVFSLFMIFYGAFRIFCEIFREPDSPSLFSFLTRGQALSIVMVIFGISLRVFLRKGKKGNML